MAGRRTPETQPPAWGTELNCCSRPVIWGDRTPATSLFTHLECALQPQVPELSLCPHCWLCAPDPWTGSPTPHPWGRDPHHGQSPSREPITGWFPWGRLHWSLVLTTCSWALWTGKPGHVGPSSLTCALGLDCQCCSMAVGPATRLQDKEGSAMPASSRPVWSQVHLTLRQGWASRWHWAASKSRRKMLLSRPR